MKATLEGAAEAGPKYSWSSLPEQTHAQGVKVSEKKKTGRNKRQMRNGAA
jgi:hypothetical protein